MNKLYDITMMLKPGMLTWPGNAPFSIEAVRKIPEGASSNISLVQMGTHSGTHVDAPRHFINDASAIDSIDPQVLIGPARVFQLPDADQINRSVLENLNFEGVDRVLFGTRNSTLLDEPFTSDYVSIRSDAAQYLVDNGIKLVGIDYLSVEGYKKEGYPTHNILLGADIVIVEGLDLMDVPEGDYELLCLPLKIKDADGAPARVLLREL